jgi:hypothetical protein
MLRTCEWCLKWRKLHQSDDAPFRWPARVPYLSPGNRFNVQIVSGYVGRSVGIKSRIESWREKGPRVPSLSCGPPRPAKFARRVGGGGGIRSRAGGGRRQGTRR